MKPASLLAPLCALTLLVFTNAASGAPEKTPASPGADFPPVKLERLFWLIHPVCWQMNGGTVPSGYLEKSGGLTAENFLYSLEWEKRVNAAQKKFMDEMKPYEALIIYPISRSPPMLDLERHAEQTLGRRCLIMRRESVNEPKVLHGMKQPIRHFLEDEAMEGREQFWHQAPKAIQDEVRAEILQACQTTGYDWNPGALKVILYNRLLAQDIKDMLAERKLIYDPATLRSVAFGEGFEQCAMTWKALIPGYVGLAQPIENNFDLSVSGAPILFDATLKDEVKLPDHVRLFLWEKADGRVMGLFYRATVRFGDRQLFAQVPIDGLPLAAWDVRKQCWPANDSPLEVVQGKHRYLKVPVFASIRKDSSDVSYYLVASGVTLAQFRDVLVKARIGQKESPAAQAGGNRSNL